MTRWLALHAEVFERFDDPLAEHAGPEAVDEHTGGEGIIPTHQPIRELKAVQPTRRGRWALGQQLGRNSRLDFGPVVAELAADVDERVPRLFHLLENER